MTDSTTTESAVPAAATAATTAAAPPPPATGFYRAEQGVPAWLVGKSPLDAAQAASELERELRTLAGVGATPPPMQPPANTDPVTGLPVRPNAQDFLTNPADATQRLLEYEKRTTFAPAMHAHTVGQAQLAQQLAAVQYRDEFHRWRPEIESLLQNATPQALSSPATWQWAVETVRSRHVNELAEERARDMMERGAAAASVRPQGAPGPATPMPNAPNMESVPPKFRGLLQARNVDVLKVEEYLRKMYSELPLEQAWEIYVKSMDGDVLSDGKDLSWEHPTSEYLKQTAPGYREGGRR